eukprot:GHVR01166067.1.p1 GENE.GHVR01166067.1~~GHVR01166067.1.p1  ORF type:complete len:152 (+),score=26.73 GHVR01166067.1:648-1103(+)
MRSYEMEKKISRKNLDNSNNWPFSRYVCKFVPNESNGVEECEPTNKLCEGIYQSLAELHAKRMFIGHVSFYKLTQFCDDKLIDTEVMISDGRWLNEENNYRVSINEKEHNISIFQVTEEDIVATTVRVKTIQIHFVEGVPRFVDPTEYISM